jgi:prenyltransferase beta subunit
MKEIKIDKKVAQQEELAKEVAQKEKERYDKAMQSFRKSPAYRYVMEHFNNSEKRIIDELEQMQVRDMKSIFMLSKIEQQLKLEEMSKRDSILSGVLSIIKQVKNKL